jgi:hypothetical protein
MQSLNVSYGTIKTILTTIPSYYVAQSEGEYDLFAVGSEMLIRSRVVASADLSDFSTHYLAKCTPVDSADDALVLGSVANKVPLVKPRTADGRERTASEKSSANRTNFYTHDFTDPCSWYPKANRVVDETATDSGNHTTYTLAHVNVIDSYHGRLTQEDDLLSTAGHSLRVAVKVNGVSKTEQDPHYGTGGDYTVNYELGHVIFTSAKSAEDVVTVTYHYATTSVFTVKPDAGKQLLIDIAEVQFSEDINPRDTVLFEVWGIADYFYPPMYVGNYPGQIPPGTLVRLQRLAYKSMSDFHNDAFRSYPSYPALGDPNNWRAQSQPVTTFDWDYLGSVALSSAKGLEIRVSLEHDEPYDGYMATATFYCRAEEDI